MCMCVCAIQLYHILDDKMAVLCRATYTGRSTKDISHLVELQAATGGERMSQSQSASIITAHKNMNACLPSNDSTRRMRGQEEEKNK